MADASPDVLTTCATVDMRWSAEEKWLRSKIFTEGVPFHVRLGGCGLGTGGGCGFPGGSFEMISARLRSASASALSRAGSLKCSVGSAVWVLGSNRHLTPIIAACSSGSPNVFPSICTSEWHPATTMLASLVASGHAVRSVYPPSPFCPLGETMPVATSLSLVSVPVLSKRQVSTLPEMGTRNDSVQNT